MIKGDNKEFIFANIDNINSPNFTGQYFFLQYYSF